MKVKKLKKLLEKVPDDYEVFCCDDEGISGAMNTSEVWIEKETKAFIISHEFYEEEKVIKQTSKDIKKFNLGGTVND